MEALLGLAFTIAILAAAQEASMCNYIISPRNFFHADITIPPRPVNISVNSVVEFTCTAVANGFTWEANQKQLDNGEGIFITSVLVQNILISTLRMAVSSTDNATNITCTAISLEPFTKDQSNPVLLLVQGMCLTTESLLKH